MKKDPCLGQGQGKRWIGRGSYCLLINPPCESMRRYWVVEIQSMGSSPLIGVRGRTGITRKARRKAIGLFLPEAFPFDLWKD